MRYCNGWIVAFSDVIIISLSRIPGRMSHLLRLRSVASTRQLDAKCLSVSQKIIRDSKRKKVRGDRCTTNAYLGGIPRNRGIKLGNFGHHNQNLARLYNSLQRLEAGLTFHKVCSIIIVEPPELSPFAFRFIGTSRLLYQIAKFWSSWQKCAKFDTPIPNPIGP